jgi:hypothetical protein
MEPSDSGMVQASFERVSADFEFRQKRVVQDYALEDGDLILKWYDLMDVESTTNEAAKDRARQFVAWDGQPAVGWVIHQPCQGGTFLTASRWQDNNEFCEQTRWQADGESTYRASAASVGMQHSHCLWQLGIVAHQARSWATYLRSDRDREARERWPSDRLSGPLSPGSVQ